MKRTAAHFLTRCFAPGETIALLLRRENPASATQRVVALEQALAPRYLAWLTHENSSGANIYVAANPLRSGSRKRTKECIASVRHLYIDIDNDGDMDIIAGNLGLNSRLTASAGQPVRLYVCDLDNNGKKEQILTYYLKGKEIPFATKQELERQIPSLKKRFLYAGDFASATLNELFTAEALQKADTLTADYFASTIFINNGDGSYRPQALPWQAQLSPFKDAVVLDANGDNLPDILLFGNFYDNNIQMGRYDADYGTLLINKGRDSFAVSPFNGPAIIGQVRHVKPIQIGKTPALVLAKNDDSARIIRFSR